MKTLKLARWIAILASGALILPAIGSLKNPVERPVYLRGYGSFVVNLVDGSLVLANAGGVATHMGLFLNEGSGNFATGELSGIATAANGDQLFWEATGPTSLVFTGGTGRFEGASGGISWVYTSSETEVEGNTMTLTYTYTGEGTVTY